MPINHPTIRKIQDFDDGEATKNEPPFNCNATFQDISPQERTYAVIIARHPSETDERFLRMLRNHYVVRRLRELLRHARCDKI